MTGTLPERYEEATFRAGQQQWEKFFPLKNSRPRFTAHPRANQGLETAIRLFSTTVDFKRYSRQINAIKMESKRVSASRPTE